MKASLLKRRVQSNVVSISSFAATVLAAALSMSAAAEVPVPDDQRETRPTIFEAVGLEASNPNFSELVDLLQTAFGDTLLEDIFDGDTKYTIFGPTNGAIVALLGELSEDEQQALLEDRNSLLTELLLYHVTFGDYYQETFPLGAIQMLSSGAAIASIHWDGEVVVIEGAPILGETILENGIFHGIGAVMIPRGFLDDLEAAATSP